MTDDELIVRIRSACVGHPSAEIPWPHRLLHEAAEALEVLVGRVRELERDLDEYRDPVPPMEKE